MVGWELWAKWWPTGGGQLAILTVRPVGGVAVAVAVTVFRCRRRVDWWMDGSVLEPVAVKTECNTGPGNRLTGENKKF